MARADLGVNDMLSDDYRMFAEEIARLELEAQEVQHLILNQTERLRLIEQRILALRSVVEGAGARTSAQIPPGLDRAIPESAEPSESDIRAARGALNTSLFGVQRAFAPVNRDAANYRGQRAPLNRVGVVKRPNIKKDNMTKTTDTSGPHIDTTS